MNHADSYRSENVSPAHRFMVILYYALSPIRSYVVEADCYADAVQEVAPGNDVLKIEVIGI